MLNDSILKWTEEFRGLGLWELGLRSRARSKTKSARAVVIGNNMSKFMNLGRKNVIANPFESINLLVTSFEFLTTLRLSSKNVFVNCKSVNLERGKEMMMRVIFVNREWRCRRELLIIPHLEIRRGIILLL
jgi:hypothetical protein